VIYVEYISRRPGVSLPEFHSSALAGQLGWAEQNTGDVLLLNVGRTWRIGPEPEYLTVWLSPDAGLDRLDEWQAIFESGEAAAVEESFSSVARIEAAGCYEPLLEPVVGAVGPYYVEFFDVVDGVSRESLGAHFERRREVLDGVELVLAADRSGLLGPDPRGLAFWRLSRFADVERFVVADSAVQPVRVLKGGLYADLGREIL